MKPFLLAIISAFAFIPLRAEPPKPAALTVGTRVFLDATVRPLDAFTARITHSAGTATLPAWELSPAQQKSFGFDPAATAAERARRIEAARDAEAARQREAEASEKRERDRIALLEADRIAREKASADERNDAAAAHAMLNDALGNAAWQQDPAVKRWRDISAAISPQLLGASNRLMAASSGDALAAAALQGAYEKRGRRPYSLSEFREFSPETKLQIFLLVPGLAPGSRLGEMQDEMEQIQSMLLARFTKEARAKREAAQGR
jgi:hypothetical protein